MTACLTKNHIGNKAFTLTELMIAVAFTVLLLTCVYGFYNISSQSYSAGISGQALQDGASIVISKIIEGGTEPSGSLIRLETSSTFYVPTNNLNILYFCQNSSCGNGTPDSEARWYTLDPTNTEVLYYHPTSNPLGYDIIYTAPPGSSFYNPVTNSKTLRFFPPLLGLGSPPAASKTVIEIDVALIATLPAGVTNQRLAISGAASTYVLLRNHP